jgi:hypothetical protein
MERVPRERLIPSFAVPAGTILFDHEFAVFDKKNAVNVCIVMIVDAPGQLCNQVGVEAHLAGRGGLPPVIGPFWNGTTMGLEIIRQRFSSPAASVKSSNRKYDAEFG